MTYQRNIEALLDDGLDDRVPDGVEGAEIQARDDDEPDDHRGALTDLAAVGPLHAAQLGHAGPQEVRGAAEQALAVLLMPVPVAVRLLVAVGRRADLVHPTAAAFGG